MCLYTAKVSYITMQGLEQEVRAAAQKKSATDKEQYAGEESDHSLSDGEHLKEFLNSHLREGFTSPSISRCCSIGHLTCRDANIYNFWTYSLIYTRLQSA